MLKPETVKKVRELFEAGVKGKDIAAQVGICETNMWSIVRRLGLPARRGHSVKIDGPRNLDDLMKYASKWGHVDFDEADLPNGVIGWIAFIDNMPGSACVTKLAALRNAINHRCPHSKVG